MPKKAEEWGDYEASLVVRTKNEEDVGFWEYNIKDTRLPFEDRVRGFFLSKSISLALEEFDYASFYSMRYRELIEKAAERLGEYPIVQVYQYSGSFCERHEAIRLVVHGLEEVRDAEAVNPEEAHISLVRINDYCEKSPKLSMSHPAQTDFRQELQILSECSLGELLGQKPAAEQILNFLKTLESRPTAVRMVLKDPSPK